MIGGIIKAAAEIPKEYWAVLIDKTLDVFLKIEIPQLVKGKRVKLMQRHLKNYLNEYSSRYLTTKTLLRMDTPVPFYDVFYPLKLQQKSGAVTIDTTDIANLFINSKCLTIIADAGSGKTTLTKHLFLNCIQREFGIPVRIELGRLDQDDTLHLEAIIAKDVFNNELDPSDSVFKETLEDGKYVFFLDGFDELPKDKSHKISAVLVSFVNKFPKNHFVLTSRPYANVEMLPQFFNYKLLPLEYEDIMEFIKMYDKNDGYINLADVIISDFKLTNIGHETSYLKNPLLLTIFIATSQDHSFRPDNNSIFYNRAVEMLLSEHDRKSKVNLERVYESGLSSDQFELILRIFSFVSYFDGKFTFNRDYVKKVFDNDIKNRSGFSFDNTAVINDFLLAAPLWKEEGSYLSFLHLTFQEYFVVLHVSRMSEDDKHKFYSKMVKEIGVGEESWGGFEYGKILLDFRDMDESSFERYFYMEMLKIVKHIFDDSKNMGLNHCFVRVVCAMAIDGMASIHLGDEKLLWTPSGFSCVINLIDKKLFDVIERILNGNDKSTRSWILDYLEYYSEEVDDEMMEYYSDDLHQNDDDDNTIAINEDNLVSILNNTEDAEIKVMQFINLIDERIQKIESDIASKERGL
jgi:hypothetical protein